MPATKSPFTRYLKTIVFIALPLVLLAIFAERWSWRPRVLVKSSHSVLGLAFSPDGRTLAVTSPAPGEPVELWDVARRTRTGALATTKLGAILAVAFSPDGRLLAGSVRDWNGERRIATWDVGSGKHHISTATDARTARQFVFAPHSGTFTTYSTPHTQTWDARTLKLLNSRKTPFGEHALGAISADGRLGIVWPHNRNPTRFPNHDLELRDARTNRVQRRFNGEYIASAVAISRDNREIAIGTTSGKILLWKLDAPQPYRVVDSSPRSISTLGFSPDGATLASAAIDDGVRLWRVR